MTQATPRTFRRIAVVTAAQLDESREWTTSRGDEMRGEAGDWLVTDAAGGERTVKADEFPSLYAPLPDGRYEAIGTVTARQATETETVETFEGPATAKPGDWVITDAGGASWPVPRDEFPVKYEEVADQS